MNLVCWLCRGTWLREATASRASKPVSKPGNRTSMLTLVINYSIPIPSSQDKHHTAHNTQSVDEEMLIWQCRSTEAVCRCSDRSAANSADSWWQWGEGIESEAHNERGSQVFQSSLPLRWRLHHFMDSLRKEAHLLLPGHQVLLRPRHLLRQRGTHPSLSTTLLSVFSLKLTGRPEKKRIRVKKRKKKLLNFIKIFNYLTFWQVSTQYFNIFFNTWALNFGIKFSYAKI